MHGKLSSPSRFQLDPMTSLSNIVKVAAVQAAPVSFDLDKSLDKLSKLTAEAAHAGAELVVFPYFTVLCLFYKRTTEKYSVKDFYRHTHGATHLTLPSVPESLVVRYPTRRYLFLPFRV